MSEFDQETALQIAKRARNIAELRGEIEKAEILIEALGKQPAADLTILVSTFLRLEDCRCEVSTASAICLLRESIEMKQQYIKTLSDWLRSALSE